MQLLHDLIALLQDPGPIIQWGGYPALALIVFLETGALIAFLPGDSLLFVAGLYAAKGDLNIVVLNLLLATMAIAGDATSYAIGSKVGASYLQSRRLTLAQACPYSGGKSVLRKTWRQGDHHCALRPARSDLRAGRGGGCRNGLPTLCLVQYNGRHCLGFLHDARRLFSRHALPRSRTSRREGDRGHRCPLSHTRGDRVLQGAARAKASLSQG